MSLLKDLIIRVVLIIALNDGVIFYLIGKRSQEITLPLALEIIIFTILNENAGRILCLHLSLFVSLTG